MPEVLAINEVKDGLAQWFWLLLVFIGFSLIFAAYYFRQQSKQLSRVISNLYRINESCHQDALDFFNQAWEELESVGCKGMEAHVEWFGEQKQIYKGQRYTSSSNMKDFTVGVEDMRFEIMFSLSRDASQPESIASLAMTTFVHIIEQDLVLKQAEILTSQKRLERYQLFVQHEIKNIAQFIQLLSEQVQSVEESEHKIKLVERLKSTLPVMAQRARKTIDQMQQPLSELFEHQQIEIELLLQEIVEMYGLDASITGTAYTTLPRQILAEVFKNILGNYRDHDVSESGIKIKISQFEANEITLVIQSEDQEHNDFQVERMFEPFWSTSESGMGLGLFLARELLKQVEGQVHFFQDKENDFVGFEIRLPVELNNR